MVWSQKILRQFQLVPPNADGNMYLGPWNKLLSTLFPPEGDLTVVPNFQESTSREGLYFSFSIDIYIEDKPVLLIDLDKKPNNLRYISKREDADTHMRRRLYDLVGTSLHTSPISMHYSCVSTGDCPLHTLYGISAFGTKVCFYSLPTVRGSAIDPPFIHRDLNYAEKGVPESQWIDDVLDTHVEDKVRRVVGEIMKNCLDV